MDWIALIEAMGGGLSAVVIAALAFTVWKLWGRVGQLHDARVQDQKECTATLLEATRSLDVAIRTLEGRR